MFQAIIRTITEMADSKKAAYSFLATIFASVLHLYFGVSVQEAMLLVSPLGLATVAQAHVDAKSASSNTTTSDPPPATVPAPPPAPPALPSAPIAAGPTAQAVAPTPQS
jgi:hypothetical protein